MDTPNLFGVELLRPAAGNGDVQGRKTFSFTDWAKDHPSDSIPGDRVDIQFNNHRAAIEALEKAVAAFPVQTASTPQPRRRPLSTPLSGPPVLGPNTGGFYAGDQEGSAATAADYAQVSIEWAEHMPDTIPPNTLAINAISGDHWSSRWWANRAALLFQSMIAGGMASVPVPTQEQVAVLSVNTLAPLSQAPADAFLGDRQIIVSGQVFTGLRHCVLGLRQRPVHGQRRDHVVWTSALYSINPGDVVKSPRYLFNVTSTVAPPTTGAFQTISLYSRRLPKDRRAPLEARRFDFTSAAHALSTTSKVEVTRNGARLIPDDGSGKGDYIVVSNAVVLLWPAESGRDACHRRVGAG